MGERLIPGGISPFVDIIDLALLSALLLVLAAVLDQAPMTSTAKIIGTMVASLISGIGLLYTWLALQELGTVTWFLFLPAIVLVLFMLFTFTTKTESL